MSWIRIYLLGIAKRKITKNIIRSYSKISLGCEKKGKEKEKGEGKRERQKKVVGGEGQSSATLSLINRATVIDYLE